jgi:hypothetical protein
MNLRYCASGWFYCRNILRFRILRMSNSLLGSSHFFCRGNSVGLFKTLAQIYCKRLSDIDTSHLRWYDSKFLHLLHILIFKNMGNASYTITLWRVHVTSVAVETQGVLYVLLELHVTLLGFELITRPEESYRLWCVVVCDLETSRMRPWPALGRRATAKNKQVT